MKRIGIIGLGNMGGNIAFIIAKKGYSLTVFDMNTVTMEKYCRISKIANDAIEVLNDSDIIILSLPSSKIVEPIILSFIDVGIKDKIIIDASTSSPISTQRLFQLAKKAGGHLVDLPLSGSPADALDSKLLALFGGEIELYEELRPLVSCFSDRYAYLGESGCGHVAKLIFNYIAMSYVNVYAMAFPLAEKMSLDSNQLYELLKTTGMSCNTLNFYAPKMIKRTYDMAFAIELAHKDLTYVKNMIEEYKVPAFALDGVLDLLKIAIKEGRGKKDCSESAAVMYEFFGGVSYKDTQNDNKNK